MNVFLRYFDLETIATNIDEIVAFMNTLEGVSFDDGDIRRIEEYLNSTNPYPYRLKFTFNNYMLILKTPFDKMEDFKENERVRKEQKAMGLSPAAEKKKSLIDFLNEEHEGWYDATIMFKRVVQIPGTAKFQYKDVSFRAQLKANSGMHCYNRVVEYLRNRQDIDPRSQYPSVKSNKFMFDFIGDKPMSCEEGSVIGPAPEG